MTVEFRMLSDALGVEVLGVNPARAVAPDLISEIRRLWLKHNIILFRGVDWTPAQQIAFTRQFGELHIMPRLGTAVPINLQQHPEIFVVSNVEENGKPVGVRRAGWGWHSDGEDKALPNMGSLLYAVSVPQHGGDTAFANTCAAYDALPESVREKIDGRRARVSRAEMHQVNYPDLPPLTEAEKKARPDIWHPITRTHPESKQQCLYIGRWAVEIEGLPADESKQLIAELTSFVTRPEFVYTHEWQVGDAILWDNRSVQHCAIAYNDNVGERHMLRTTLEGDTPYFEAASGERVLSSPA
jgi:alpha-ketoglutarate-dependent taurine dioxygenase